MVKFIQWHSIVGKFQVSFPVVFQCTCKYSLGHPVVFRCSLGQSVAFKWYSSVHWSTHVIQDSRLLTSALWIGYDGSRQSIDFCVVDGFVFSQWKRAMISGAKLCPIYSKEWFDTKSWWFSVYTPIIWRYWNLISISAIVYRNVIYTYPQNIFPLSCIVGFVWCVFALHYSILQVTHG